MPSKLFFQLFIDRPADATSELPDKQIGYFACMPWSAKYLDIEAKAVKPEAGGLFTIRKSAKRTLTRVDGSTMSKGPKSDDNVGKGRVMLGLPSGKGMKRVVIQTGKKIVGTASKKKDVTHTISFAFPSIASNLIIAQALGRLIPSTKFAKDATPAETDILPYFRSRGGRKYPIILIGSGTSTQDQDRVKVGDEITDADAQAMENQRIAKQG